MGSEGFARAGTLRSEYVVAVTGTVEKRAAAVNENLKTGDIEVIAEDIRILSESETPPFPIEEDSQTKEDLRLRYRYLDLRRPDIQRNMMMKIHAGRSQGLSGAQPGASWDVLRTASVSPVV